MPLSMFFVFVSRQHNMEMAAFALVTAIEGGGEVGTDSDSCSDGECLREISSSSLI